MKSTLKTKTDDEQKETTYPCLKMTDVSKFPGCPFRVVLFTEYGTGTCVYFNDNGYKGFRGLGEFSDDWTENLMLPFTDKIILEN